MKPKIRIAEIPYLNCAPFYWRKDAFAFEHCDVEWVSWPPKKLGEMAMRGDLAAGPFSLVDGWTLEPQFEPLDNFGITTPTAAKSVLLFSKKPVMSLKNESIGVTNDTATSVWLMQMILQQRYGVTARHQRGFSAEDAARLLIGDDALHESLSPRLTKEFSYVFDLGVEWSQWQNLPFVFARWMVSKTLPPEIRAEIVEYLTQSLGSVDSRKGEFENYLSHHGHFKLSAMKEYLSAFQYRWGEKEKAAMEKFKSLLPQEAIVHSESAC